MPIQILNDYGSVTLGKLIEAKRLGYSILKSPHVGNQHPCNLVCAKLGLPVRMVSMTKGSRDKNFHPHLRIENGTGTQIANPEEWTPLARTSAGESLELYHQSALKQRFPSLEISLDYEAMLDHPVLSERILRAATGTISRLWYRKVDATGSVVNGQDLLVKNWRDVCGDIFQLDSQTNGFVMPNRVHIFFDFVWQSLSSGRDVVYHLAGPQFVGYVGGVQRSLSLAYDVLRREEVRLPETLQVCIVPVASCRFITHASRSSSIAEVDRLLRWYDELPHQERRLAAERFREVARAFPEFFVSIESATCLSQYDIEGSDDLVLADWMIETELHRMGSLYSRFLK